MVMPNEKLRQARLEKHWSIAVASRQAGVSTNTFNRWERGLQVPQLATLDQLCAAFGMSAENLGFGYVVSPQKDIEVALLLEGTVEVGREEIVPSRRRRVLATLIGSSTAAFDLPQHEQLSVLHAEEILLLGAAHIPLCWQLYFEGGLLDIEPALPRYIAQLSRLADQPSPQQKQAASLLSQALQLASLLATQHQDYGTAAALAEQGLQYGEIAEDPALQAASLVREALVYFYLKRILPRYQVYQKALQLVSRISPLLQSRVYGGLAEVYSVMGQEGEAWHYLEKARAIFPRRVEDYPDFAYTHVTASSVSTVEGRIYLNLHQPGQAWSSFAQIEPLLSRERTPKRLELLIHQAMSTCASGELEQTCDLLEVAVPMARHMGSLLRLDECYEVYERLLARWAQEQAVKNLEAIFYQEVSSSRGREQAAAHAFRQEGVLL